MKSKLGKLELCIPALVMASCAAEPVETGEVIQLDQGSNTLSLSEMSSSALSTAKLDSTSAASMGNTAAARKVLTFAAGCALDSTQSVTFTVNNIQYTVTGRLGIATGWTSGALTSTQAAWVSACVFAHMNQASAVIWISVRGNATGLGTTVSERNDYQVEEGAFWGNAFASVGAIAGYSCVGLDQAANDTYGDLPNRQCAQWDGVPSSHLSACGISYAGACSSVCTTSVAPYAGCSFLGGSATSTVVTTFLAGDLP